MAWGGERARREGGGRSELAGVELDTAAYMRQWRPNLGHPGGSERGFWGQKEEESKGYL